MTRKVYKTRVSLLYIPIFFVIFCPILIIGNYALFAIFSIIGGISAVLCYIVFRSMRYEIFGRELLCFYLGSTFCRIPISMIASIERSYNPYNGLAASLKRLRLHFNKGYKWNHPSWYCLPLISPEYEQEFLETLKVINPNIQINVCDKKGWWRFWDWDF